MSTCRDATQTVKQKFDVLTELIEDVNQKMDQIVARIDDRAPCDTTDMPMPRPRSKNPRLANHITAFLAVAVVSVVGLTVKSM